MSTTDPMACPWCGGLLTDLGDQAACRACGAVVDLMLVDAPASNAAPVASWFPGSTDA